MWSYYRNHWNKIIKLIRQCKLCLFHKIIFTSKQLCSIYKTSWQITLKGVTHGWVTDVSPKDTTANVGIASKHRKGQETTLISQGVIRQEARYFACYFKVVHANTQVIIQLPHGAQWNTSAHFGWKVGNELCNMARLIAVIRPQKTLRVWPWTSMVIASHWCPPKPYTNRQFQHTPRISWLHFQNVSQCNFITEESHCQQLGNVNPDHNITRW